MTATVTVLYFASLREAAGIADRACADRRAGFA